MRRAIAAHKSGRWPEEAAIDRVTLAFVDRHRRRLRLVADSGNPFLLDLPRVQHLADGDGLELEDGAYVRVCAKPERVLEIEAHTAAELLRLAWHLGNRNLPIQALENRLRVRDDHLIGSMIEGLGGRVIRLSAPFDPGIDVAPAAPRRDEH
jgi:urease accessory protein